MEYPNMFRDFLAARTESRKLFSATYPGVEDSFEVAIHNGRALGAMLTTGRGPTGHSHVSLVPFFLIFERQVHLAFEALSSRQSYNAWVSVRPGMEAALIMGKWVADPKNADVWAARVSDPEKYRRAYQGKALGKGALPNGPIIQSAVKHINDFFVHPNPTYYYRHLRFEEADAAVELHLDFFDEEADVSLGAVGLLHLVIFIQDALARMFGALFSNIEPPDIQLDDFRQKASPLAAAVRESGPYFRWALREICLWPDDTAIAEPEPKS